MMKTKGLSFKKENATGRYRSFQPDYTHVKFKKKKCGCISKQIGQLWKIELQVVRSEEDKLDHPTDPCQWQWIQCKKQFHTEDEARTWLHESWSIITDKYEVWMEE